jgi:cell division protein FtsX
MMFRLTPLAKALNLPRTRLFGLLGVLAALLALMIALLGSSGVMLQQLYSSWDLAKRHSIMVYLPPTTPTEALAPLYTAFAQNPALERVEMIPPSEVAAALTPVFPDAALASSTVPLPIVAEVVMKAGQPRAPMLALLQETYPMAELDDQQPMVETIARSVRLLQTAGLMIALALGTVLVLFMALTIRAGLLAQHATVELLIQLGATDAALTRTMALQTAQPVWIGSWLGGALAGLMLLLGQSLYGFALPALVWGMVVLPIVGLPVIAIVVAWLVGCRVLHHA